MYVIRCLPTEVAAVYYYAGTDEKGTPLFAIDREVATRFPNQLEAERAANPLLYDRRIRTYRIEPED